MNIFCTYVEDEWIRQIIECEIKRKLTLVFIFRNLFLRINHLSFDEIALDFVHIEEIRFDYALFFSSSYPYYSFRVYY